MVLNATFNNISVISCQSVSLVGETNQYQQSSYSFLYRNRNRKNENRSMLVILFTILQRFIMSVTILWLVDGA
jgi:hypothetical protein